MFGQQAKVFLGTTSILVVTYIGFVGLKSDKKGHNLFDVEKPEAVERIQTNVTKGEKK